MFDPPPERLDDFLSWIAKVHIPIRLAASTNRRCSLGVHPRKPRQVTILESSPTFSLIGRSVPEHGTDPPPTVGTDSTQLLVGPLVVLDLLEHLIHIAGNLVIIFQILHTVSRVFG